MEFGGGEQSKGTQTQEKKWGRRRRDFQKGVQFSHERKFFLQHNTHHTARTSFIT